MNRLKKITIILCTLIFSYIATTPVKAAGDFSITPASGTYIQECNSSVIVTIDVSSGASNAADVIINYDPTKIEIIDSNPSLPGVQIATGTAFENYVGNIVNTSTGEIKLIGYSTISTLNGVAEFATIQFKPLATATSGQFSFEFTGADPYNTLDSNIADSTTSFDMLTSVSNANYTFTSGACATDTQPPTITFNYPKNFTKNVAANSTVSFTVSDSTSGIDISTIVAYINGEKYTSFDPEVSISGTPTAYTLIVNPRVSIPQGSQSVETVSATDNAGNTKNSSIIFNIPEGEKTVCPEIIKEIKKACPAITPIPSVSLPPKEPQSPTIVVTSDTTNLKLEKTRISITVTDDSGIVPESFMMQIGGKIFSLSATPEAISVDGTLNEYVFEIDLDIADLESDENGNIFGFARVTDIDGNTRIENIILRLDEKHVSSTNTGSMSKLSQELKTAFSISLGALALLAITFYVMLPTLVPASIQVFNANTNKALAFPRAYFMSSKGKKLRKLGLINGKLIGKIPQEGGIITIQKYGYSPQQVSIPQKSTNELKKSEPIKVYLTKI